MSWAKIFPAVPIPKAHLSRLQPVVASSMNAITQYVNMATWEYPLLNIEKQRVTSVYCLINRDLYIGFLESQYNWAV